MWCTTLDYLNRHATGVTMSLFIAIIVALSALPVPEWLRPLSYFETDDPGGAFVSAVLRRSESDDFTKWQEQDAAEVAAEDLVTEGSDAPAKEEIAPVAVDRRRRWVRVKHPRFDRKSKEVGAVPSPLSIPCVSDGPEGCERHALDRFFGSLKRAEEGDPGAKIRVVHFGDSLIASDHITDMVRLRLQQRFGSGGRGFLLVDRLSRFAGRRVRTGKASLHWNLDVITARNPPDRFFGYTGASFTAVKDRQDTVFDVGDNRSVQIFYFRYPRGGKMEVFADGQRIAEVDTTGNARICDVESLTLPEGTKKLRVVARTRGVRIFGVALEAEVPGVVYESIGLPGATSAVWMFPDEANFQRQLVHRAPQLVVTMLGGNDGLMLSKKRTTLEDIERDSRAFLKRIQSALPNADCLVTSPMDAARTKVGGAMIPKPEVPMIVEMQKRIAADHGCAFWDMWGSMGGSGSLKRWFDAGMINPDMIHPRGFGGDLLGEMMSIAVMDGYDSWLAARTAAPEENPFVDGTLALEADADILDSLTSPFRALGSKSAARIKVLQLSDVHRRRPHFERALRRVFRDRFGKKKVRYVSQDWSKKGVAKRARKEKPDLVLIFAGEAQAAEPEPVQAELDAFGRALAGLRSAVPGAACLVIGPLTPLHAAGSDAFVPSPGAALTTEYQRLQAASAGCAFWSASSAAGGDDAMQRWFGLQPRLVQPDRATPTKAGYRELARFLGSDLLTVYESTER